MTMYYLNTVTSMFVMGMMMMPHRGEDSIFCVSTRCTLMDVSSYQIN